MKNIQTLFVIVGEVPCCICHNPMSQKDVDDRQAIASTCEMHLPLVFTIAHLNHFYVEVNGQLHETDNYELSMMKFALACAKNDKMLTQESEARFLAKIGELEKKLSQMEK